MSHWAPAHSTSLIFTYFYSLILYLGTFNFEDDDLISLISHSQRTSYLFTHIVKIFIYKMQFSKIFQIWGGDK
jgi:hypothetical protein